MTPYEFAINNTKTYITSDQNKADVLQGTQLDAFVAARVLAIAFMKDGNEVLMDLILGKKPNENN